MQVELFGVPWLGTTLIVAGVLFVVLVVATTVMKTKRQMAGPEEEKTDPGIRPSNGLLFGRFSPLFYEQNGGGQWKISLGRVSFWIVNVVFVLMCILVMRALVLQQDVKVPMVTLYMGVITLVFLVDLGLLAYNLGTKFTKPMSTFLASWNGKGTKTGMIEDVADVVSTVVKPRSKDAAEDAKEATEADPVDESMLSKLD